jgi:hypothetical protein
MPDAAAAFLGVQRKGPATATAKDASSMDMGLVNVLIFHNKT